MSSNFTFPGSQLVFGKDAAAESLKDTEGFSRVMVIAGTGTRSNESIVQMVEASLGDRLVGWYSDVNPNILEESVTAGAAFARSHDVDLIVAVGGGSAVGLAKMVASLAAFSGTDEEYFAMYASVTADEKGRRTWPTSPRLALWTVPTTHSGSELNGSSSIVRPSGRKLPIRGHQLAPDKTIYDPAIAATTPRTTYLTIAFNSLDHCLEMYCSRFHDPFVDGLALSGTSSFARCFKQLANQEFASYEDAVGAIQVAGALSSLCVHNKMIFENSGHGFLHALGHTLRSHCDVPQGVAHTIVIPEGLSLLAQYVPSRLATLGRAMGADASLNENELALAPAAFVRRWRERLDLPSRLRDFVPSRGALAEVAEEAMNDTSVRCAPFDATKDDLLGVLERSW